MSRLVVKAAADTREAMVPLYRTQLVREKEVATAWRAGQLDAYGYPQITSPDAVENLMLTMFGADSLDKEIFCIFMLDTKNRIIGVTKVSEGSLNSSIVHPREVFKPALIAGAASIIVSHNHPSGDPSPSREDIEVTRRLSEAGKLVGVELLDHVVIGYGHPSNFSLKQKGLM